MVAETMKLILCCLSKTGVYTVRTAFVTSFRLVLLSIAASCISRFAKYTPLLIFIIPGIKFLGILIPGSVIE